MVTIVNHSQAQKHINIPGKEAGTFVQTLVIPAARQNPDDRSQLIHGRLEDVDAEQIADARKRFPVVESWFKSGDLRIADTGKAAKDKKKTGAKPDDAPPPPPNPEDAPPV